MTWHGPYGVARPGRWFVDADGTRWRYPEEGGWLILDGGTLDFGVIRDSTGWPALRYALLRPWRWRGIPRILRSWPARFVDSTFVQEFSDPKFLASAVRPDPSMPRVEPWPLGPPRG